MKRENLESVVFEIIKDLFGVNRSELSRSPDLEKDLRADELDVVELTMEFEDEFDISIPDEDVANTEKRSMELRLKTIGQWLDYLEKLVL